MARAHERDGAPARSARSAVRLRDVAALARVSPATVSRTLNHDPRVAPELQQRVRTAVDELGYRRNQVARSLRRQRVDAIGVVVPDVVNPHFSEMIGVVEDEAFRHGLRVLVCDTNESGERQGIYLRMLRDDRVAGVLLSPSDPSAPEIRELLDGGTPVVAFDRDVLDPRADAVVADNVEGAATATQLLINLGHTRIAFVGGREGVETADDRLSGYREAIDLAGPEPLVASADFQIEGGRLAVQRLLTSPRQPTAVVVANNMMTLGSLKATRDAGLRILADLAL